MRSPRAPGAGRALRVLFMGTACSFPLAPLEALIQGGVQVCAVVVPAPARLPGTPAITVHGQFSPLIPCVHSAGRLMVTASPERTILEVASAHSIPVLQVGALHHPDTLRALASYNPDVMCVACFPRRLPRALLELPRVACINLHPSLLPANRGPAPLFWTLRDGDEVTGVSVHIMDEDLDSGDILEQEIVELPDGASGAQLDRLCSAVGAPLMVRAVRSLVAGTETRTPQRPELATYRPWPSQADFELSVDRPAMWAYNFIRGVCEWPIEPVIQVGGERFTVRAALGYEADGRLRDPYRRSGSEVWIQFSPGVLHVTAVKLSQPSNPPSTPPKVICTTMSGGMSRSS